MRSIRRQNTVPELVVRSALHRSGFRFRLHDKRLPGTPDLVLRKHKAVIFVNGCFWHGHNCRHGRARPKHNAAWWLTKLAENKQRDRRKRRQLRALGWRVIDVWECQVRRETWTERVMKLLSASAPRDTRAPVRQ